MPSLIAEDRVSIIDLTDRGQLTAYIDSNQPRIQMYDNVQHTYSPDYSVSPHLVLTPVVYLDDSQILLSDENLSITWKRKIGSTEYDLITGETVSNKILTVSVNVLDTLTPYITYVAHVSYLDSRGYTIITEASNDISLVTSGDVGNSVVFTIYAPNGTVFTNGQGTKRIQTSAYYGSTIVSGATYKWYDYGSGVWTLIAGATNDYLDVNGSDIVGQDSFKCVMTYQGMDYTDVITLIDKTDNYQCDIDSTSGDMFKNSVGQTYLVANLYQNGEIVDEVKCNYEYFGVAPSNPSTGDFYHKKETNSSTMPLMRYNGTAWQDVTNNDTYKYEKVYTWYRRDASGNAMDNGNAFATGKVIYVDNTLIENKCTFVCEVQNDVSGPLISTGNYTIVDVTDPIVSGSAPLNPVQGLVWFDTTNNIMKIYDNGTWKVVGASDSTKNKVFTSVPIPPYKVGDLWLTTDANGNRVIYYCTTARDSGSYVTSDWIPASDYQTPTQVITELQNFTSNVISPLYGSIDSTIEAWYTDTDPSVNWTTDQLKTEHIGDTWYKNSSTPGTVELKRYTYNVGTGTFSWQPVNNLAALEAYEFAGTKRRVFFLTGNNTPTPPYDEGDLWSQGETGNLLICKIPKTSGQSFSESDWEESARYTVDRELLQKQIDGRIQIWFQDLDPESYAGIVSFTWSNEDLSVGISGDEFETTDRQSGTYEFIYNGSSWTLNGSTVSLSSYGISIVVGTPENNDKITVVFQKPNDDVPWTTAVKAKHCGDLWYAPSTKITKRYTEYINNNVSSFGWEISDSLEAIRAAQNAQASADGNLNTFYIKNALSYSSTSEITASIVEFDWNRIVDETGTYVFEYDGSKWELTITHQDSSTEGPYEVSLSDYGIKVTGDPENGSTITVNFTYNHPVPPYDIGDLWVNGDSGEILVCKITKESSDSFSKSDWDYGDALNVFVNATYNGDINYLEGLIDNKIDTWFQTDNPSIVWATNDERNAHIGDKWYKDDTHIYYYDKVNGVFNWIQYDDINDPPESGQTYGPIRLAMQAASAAQDTRDGRRRLFIGSSNPIPPYDRGDIWTYESGGSTVVKYCNTARKDGDSYIDTDFSTTYSDFPIYVGTSSPSDTTLLWLDISNIGNPSLKQYVTIDGSSVWAVIGEPTKIYTSQPVPPYNVGDTWVYYDPSNSLAIIKICVESKSSSEQYDISDWASQPTEDQINISPSPPTDTNKLWIDTSELPYVLKYYSNGSWVNIGAIQDLSEIREDIEQIRGQITNLSSVMEDYSKLIQMCNAATSRSDLIISIERGSWFDSNLEYGTYEFIYDGTDWELNGTAVTLSDYYIEITSGTPVSNDKITVNYYTTKSVLGFSVTNYEETYSTLNGNVEELLAQKEIQDQYFDFTDGFTVGTSSNRSAVNIKNSGITLRDTAGNDALTIKDSGVNTKAVNVSNSLKLDVLSTFLLGNYRIDFTASGMSLVWNN